MESNLEDLFNNVQYYKIISNLEIKKELLDPNEKFWLSRSYIQLRRAEEAEEILDELQEKFPKNAVYKYWFGHAKLMTSEDSVLALFIIKSCLSIFEESVEIDPKFDLALYMVRIFRW